jgi:hypothetical protein
MHVHVYSAKGVGEVLDLKPNIELTENYGLKAKLAQFRD